MSDVDSGSFFDTWTNNENDDDRPITEPPSFADYTSVEVVEVVDHLSDTQVKILSLLFVFSATLSVLGSSTIVYKVLKNRSKATPYDRLMLGLSSSDIVASISWILTPFLLPEETSPRIWASGTDQTCTFLGTISQFGYLAIFYNLVLSFYYLFTVRFGMKREVFAKRYEPFIHVFGLVYFSTTAVVGAVLGIYTEVDIGLGCWVNDYPVGCEVDMSCTSPQIAWAFGAGPLLITLIALATNNTIIYCHVRRTLGKGVPQPSVSTMMDSSLLNEQQEHAKTSLSHEQLQQNRQQKLLQKRPSMRDQQAQLERTLQHQRHVREVATQGFLYVVTFFCAYTPNQILRAVEAYAAVPVSESPMFPLFVINSILVPLQGFFNVFVYVRPNYTRIRIAYPELSPIWAIQRACLDPDIPRLTEASRMSTARSNRSNNNFMYRKSGTSTGSGGMLVVAEEQNNSGSGSSSGSMGRNNTNHTNNSGRAFSSDLDVVHEDSDEDDTEFYNDEEENAFSLTEEVKEILNDMKQLEAAATAAEQSGLPPAPDRIHQHTSVKDDTPPSDQKVMTAKATFTNDAMPHPGAALTSNTSSKDDDFDIEQEYKKIYCPSPEKPSSLRTNFDGSITQG